MVQTASQAVLKSDEEERLSEVHDESASEETTLERNPSVLAEVDALMRMEAPPERYLSELLAVQCRLSGADGAVLLQVAGEKGFHVLAVHPGLKPKDANATWIQRAAQYAGDVIINGKTVVSPENLGPNLWPGQYLILIPIQIEKPIRTIASFIIRATNPKMLSVCRQQLEMTPFLLHFYEVRLTLGHRHAALGRIRTAMELLSAFNRSKRFMGAAMALCNETAARYHCDRVSLGVLKDRCVHVQAMSHTDKINRKMKLLQDIEAAMEECLDQDMEVVHPAPQGAVYVSRAAAQLSRDHGPASLVSLPIRQEDRVGAVLTMERPSDRPFTVEEIEDARLASNLCGPRLLDLQERDRWIGALMADALRRTMARMVGPSHTWLKLCVVGVFLLATFLVIGKGEYRVEAPFTIQATVQQAVVAPFDSFIKSVSVVPGDEVTGGKNVLGTLETSELRLQLAVLKAEQLGHQKQMTAAMRDNKIAESQMAQAKSDKAAAEISLLEQRLALATLIAPITGRIISEDLKKQIGAPVKTGAVLFEIAPIESLRGELYVPEDLISDVLEGQEGALASVGHPEQRIPFQVERINPIADVINHHNVFKVRAKLHDQPEWMRPGMEGLAKISVGRANYLWMGSRRLINWLRMKLWI